MQKKLYFSAGIAVIIILVVSAVSFSHRHTHANGEVPHYSEHIPPPPVVVPYINPAYYDCISVLPIDLENSYNRAARNATESETYGGRVYLFKDLLVDAYMLKDLDRGYIWADLTKCQVLDIPAAKQLKFGDRVDIVGILVGRDPDLATGLDLRDSYIMPTGCLQLPAPGSGTVFVGTSGY